MKLDRNKIYDLSELTSEELNNIWEYLTKNDEHWYTCPLEEVLNQSKTDRLLFDKYNWQWCNISNPTANAKELFYTLEDVQVDCSELTQEQIKEMCNVYESNGYKQWIDPEAFIIIDNFIYLRIDSENEFYITGGLDTKTTITYEKFMELFSYKEKSQEFKNLVDVLNEELTEEYNKETEYEVKYIAEKPKQYQIGIDTFNPQPHYNNENGSLYKIANDLGLNHWEFDIFKRLVRCRKKNQFKEDLQKIKDTIDIYLNEYSDEKEIPHNKT